MVSHEPHAPASPHPVSETAESERKAALDRVTAALDTGALTPHELDRLLSRALGHPGAAGRPAPSSVVSTLGAIVVFGGVAIAYGTLFLDMPHALRLTTPFAFPLVALAAFAVLRRRSAAPWLQETAAYVVYASLGGACVTTGGEAGWLGDDRIAAPYVIACAVLGIAVAAGMFAGARIPRMFAVGLGIAVPALGLGLAHLMGVSSAGTMAWVVLGEAGAATAAAVVLHRGGRPEWRYAAYWAMLGAWAASVVGASSAGPEQFSAWHVVLIAAVVAALIAATTRGLTMLVWIAALAGLQWLQMICVVVGSATNSAFAVILAGLGLVGLGIAVKRAAERARPVT